MKIRTGLLMWMILPALVAVLLSASLAIADTKEDKGGKKGSQQAATPNSCVTCHGDRQFLVRNKKLFDYFQAWKVSIHGLNKVMCQECHGGDPRQSSKESAHGTATLASGQTGSPTSYRNVPDTCARCHEDVYNHYRQSSHFKHLGDLEKDKQGPNCVTCHGSVNITVLNVSTVRNTCAQCHNKDTGNYPEIPDQAEAVLSQFLSVHRYYRYIAVKGDPGRVKSIFKVIDPRVKRLNASWHTFDLEKVTQDTNDLLDFLKTQRDQLQREEPRRDSK